MGNMDLSSAFSTTDHHRMLLIMHDPGFPQDAIEVVKDLYRYATTQLHLPQGGHSDLLQSSHHQVRSGALLFTLMIPVDFFSVLLVSLLN